MAGFVFLCFFFHFQPSTVFTWMDFSCWCVRCMLYIWPNTHRISPLQRIHCTYLSNGNDNSVLSIKSKLYVLRLIRNIKCIGRWERGKWCEEWARHREKWTHKFVELSIGWSCQPQPHGIRSEKRTVETHANNRKDRLQTRYSTFKMS